MKFSWSTLLRPARFSTIKAQASESPPEAHPDISVSPFTEDIARIAYSSPFRRLQAKTQVQPFPKTDYFRTRLTHTIEASIIGQRMARALAAKLYSSLGTLPEGYTAEFVSEIISAACLAHDIGNPPFGHVGEYAVQAWVRSNKRHSLLALAGSDPRFGEFERIDGNALGLRILTRLQGWRNKGGLQLT